MTKKGSLTRSLVWNLLQRYFFRLKKFQIYWICCNSKQAAIGDENNKRKILNFLLLSIFCTTSFLRWKFKTYWRFINLTQMMAILRVFCSILKLILMGNDAVVGHFALSKLGIHWNPLMSVDACAFAL